MASIRVAAVSDIPVGASKAYEIAGHSILLCHSSSGMFAIDNMCSHALAPLEGGKVKGHYIFCPLHGVRFDLKDGTPNGTLTRKPVRVFPVSVADGNISIELPSGHNQT